VNCQLRIDNYWSEAGTQIFFFLNLFPGDPFGNRPQTEGIFFFTTPWLLKKEKNYLILAEEFLKRSQFLFSPNAVMF